MFNDLLLKNNAAQPALEELKGAAIRPNLYKEDAPKEVKYEFTKKDLMNIKSGLSFENDSVDQLTFDYVVEFLTPQERIALAKEIYRVLRKNGKATLKSSYWAASKAYGDLDVQWPPVSEAWYSYLDKEIREKLYPDDTIYTGCDFILSMGYGMHQSIVTKHPEAQQHSIIFYKEAAQDLISTLIKI